MIPRFILAGLAVLPLWGAPVLAGEPVLPRAEKTPFLKAVDEEAARRRITVSASFLDELRNGKLELRSKNYIGAASRFGGAYQESKEHPLPPLLIGVACVGMAQFDKASEFLRHALRVWPGLPRAGLDLRDWLLDEEEIRNLGTRLDDEIFSRKPGSEEASRALFTGGFFFAYGGDPEKGRKYLAAVPEGATERVAARLVLHAVDAPPSSRVKGAPQDPFKWGNELFLAGKYREAAHAFAAAAVADPSNPLACFEMGHALFAAGYYRHASRVLALGIERCPTWGGVEMDRVTFYAEGRREDFGAEMQRLAAWTESHPEDGAAWFLLGYNRYFSNARPASRAAFEAAAKAGWEQQARYFLDWLDGRKSPSKDGGGTPPPPEEGPAPPEPAPPEEKPPPVNPVEEGRRLLASGDYDGASAFFIRAISSKEGKVEGMMGLAATWLGKGDFQNASLWVRNGLRTDWDRASRMPWADALDGPTAYAKRLEDLASLTAEIHERRAEGRRPEAFEREIWFLYGYCLFRSGEGEKAAEQFKQIILEVATADAEAVKLYEQIKK